MILSELNGKVFILGTSKSGGGVRSGNGFLASLREMSIKVRKLVGGEFLTCMWTSQALFDSWIACRGQPQEHFDLDMLVAFKKIFERPQVRFVYLDPPSELDPFDAEFDPVSAPSSCRIDVHSVVEVWDILVRQPPASRLSADEIGNARMFASAHPEFGPAVVFPKYAQFRREQAIEEKSRASASRMPRGAIPEAVRHEVWRRDLGKCVQCGSRLRLEFDHIIPFSKGGSSTARNIQLLCESCNRAKRDSI